MSLVSFSKVCIQYAGRKVIDGATFSVGTGMKIGLVGENGSGKSTIIKLIAGELEPDDGRVSRSAASQFWHLPQVSEQTPGCNAVDCIMQAHPSLAKLRNRIKSLESSDMDESQASEYAEAIGRYEAVDGYRLEQKAHSYLDKLGLDPTLRQRSQGELSGGERAAINLATALLSNADLLLLDEPDNHLDLVRIQWLKQQLVDYPGSLVLVSHDREIIDSVCTHILEVENSTVALEQGSLASYLERKRKRAARRQIEYVAQQQRIAELKRDIQSTEERARRFEGLSTNDHWRRIGKKVAKAAVVRKRRLERELDEEHRIDRPRERKTIRFALAQHKSQRHVLALRDVNFGYGPHMLLRDVSLELEQGERIVITGGNGTGKTTLLRIALGRLAPSSGDVWRAELPFFYCDQQQAGLEADRSALEMLRSASGCSHNRAHHILARMMLKNREALKPVSVLSGGERTRLLLAVLTHLPVGLAVLDEPTNHLDIPSMEVLERALADYKGGALLVSHDQRLITNIATDIYSLHEGRLIRQ